MKRMLSLLLALLLLPLYSALAADDACVLDLGSLPGSVTTTGNYLRIAGMLTEAEPIVITLYGDNSEMVYQRNYGLCSGSFRSEDMYLRLTGSQTRYLLYVQCGSSSASTEVFRVLPMLQNNTACSAGYPLSVISGQDTRQTVTLLDTAALAAAPLTVPLHASGAYGLGWVTFSMRDGLLTVEILPDAAAEIQLSGGTVYAAATSVAAAALGNRQYRGVKADLDGLTAVLDLQGAAYAAVYVQLTVSFSPSGASMAPMTWLDGQDQLWLMLMQQTENEAVG